MINKTKLWHGVQALTILGSASLIATGCNSEVGSEGAETGSDKLDTVSAEGEGAVRKNQMAEGEGASEGEGSGGATAQQSDMDYLLNLSLMRGHLWVGYQLAKQAHMTHAVTHMKHPESELYAKMIPAFAARNAPGFALELKALSNAVESGAEFEVIDKTYANLQAAIGENEAAVAPDFQTDKNRLLLASKLLRVAADEYAIAVVDGQMENAHEYQDALGFTTMASRLIEKLDDAELKSQAASIVESTTPLWPDVMPPDTLTTEAGQLYGAAARVELLGLGLD